MNEDAFKIPKKMSLWHSLRRLFGLRPKTGDYVKGDWGEGIQFEGIVIQDDSNNRYLPHYKIKGILFYRHPYKMSYEKEYREVFTLDPQRVFLA